ncbi:MAG: hypothetical protein MUD00_00935 [Candidatus Pacebacteria bacterium]|jgi:hypothetical protein|nr:hypothetical protein [Candidatus Paceibacterota bacterium]
MEGFPQNIPKIENVHSGENKIEKLQIKEGVDFVFEQHPELAEIGTKEQYSEYLDTVFPESKIKDIVYHGTDAKNLQNILINGFSKEKEGCSIRNAVFFARKYNAYGNDAYESDGKVLIPVLVNTRNIQIVEDGSINHSDISSVYKEGKDALLQILYDVNSYKDGKKLSFEQLEKMRENIENQGLNEILKNTKLSKEEVIAKLENETERDFFLENYVNKFGVENIPFGQLTVAPEKIHILGSKADIVKFGDFMQ